MTFLPSNLLTKYAASFQQKIMMVNAQRKSSYRYHICPWWLNDNDSCFRFETSSTSLTFTSYLLAKHRQVQERLRDEITSVLSKHVSSVFLSRFLPFLILLLAKRSSTEMSACSLRFRFSFDEPFQGRLTYDNVFGMRYLDQVISESLRMYPPVVGLSISFFCFISFTLIPDYGYCPFVSEKWTARARSLLYTKKGV